MNISLPYTISVEPQQEGCFRTSIRPARTLEAILWGVLLGYWRWKAEGSPTSPLQEGSIYYNPYKERVVYDTPTDTYRMEVQIDDADVSDTWVIAVCRLQGLFPVELEVLEKREVER